VHTLWQAAAFAGLLGIVLLLLRKHSARMRYLTAIGVLGTFFLTVLLTFGGLYRAAPVANGHGEAVTTEALPTQEVLPAETAAESPLLSVSDPAPAAAPKASFRARMVAYYDAHLPLIVTLWLMGVLVLQLRFIGQLAFLQRLKNYGAERFPSHLSPLLSDLEAKLNLKKPVRYLTSYRVNSPFTTGWLRPVVMFPHGLLGELEQGQLKTIIAHELAHIKRYDFLVNMIQTLLCILFFYHPAAWWISARIDEEREHCCDDLAIEATGERVGYARTLLRLKETEMVKSGLAMGLLGKGDGFKGRVTRLITGGFGTGTYGEGFTTAVIIFCFMGLAVTLSGQEEPPVARENVTVVTAPPAPSGSLAQRPPAPVAPPPPVAPEADQTPENTGPATSAEPGPEPEYKESGFLPATSVGKFDLFINAIREGDLELVEYFLEEEKFDLDQTNDEGFTPLMAAASENQAVIARRLIEAGADVNFVNGNGWTALIEAADEGAMSVAQVLLEQGARVDVAGAQRSAADLAASEGHPEMLKLLVRHGADITGDDRRRSPLHEAAEEGQFFVVQELLQLGANAGAVDRQGRTPLSYAAEEGQGAVVALLGGQGYLNVEDHEGRTPLIYAAREGHEEVVSLLEVLGATHVATDHDDHDALYYAAGEGQTEVVRHLLERGVSARGGGDCPAVFAAVREGHEEVIRLLAGGGANLNDGCSYQDTDFFGRRWTDGSQTLARYQGAPPLVVAITETDARSAATLLRFGADVNSVNAKARYRLRREITDYHEIENLRSKDLEDIYATRRWTPLMGPEDRRDPRVHRHREYAQVNIVSFTGLFRLPPLSMPGATGKRLPGGLSTGIRRRTGQGAPVPVFKRTPEYPERRQYPGYVEKWSMVNS